MKNRIDLSVVESIVITAVVIIFAVLLFSISSRFAGATSFHTSWQNKGDVNWSETCNVGEVSKVACGETLEGTQEGTQKQECKLVGGRGYFECIVGQDKYVKVSRPCTVEAEVCPVVDVCSNLEGTQAVTPEGYTNNDGYCEEIPPVVVPEVKKSNSNSSCDKPGVVGSFRYDVGTPGDGVVTLRWTPKSKVKNVDITVYAQDKLTVQRKLRTEDDGKYVLSGLDSQAHWFKIRAMNSCGFGDWSKKIDPAGL